MRFFFFFGTSQSSPKASCLQVDRWNQFSVSLILTNIVTVKPFSVPVSFVAYFRVVCELRSSILFWKLSRKSSRRSYVVVKISSNEHSLSTIRKIALDEEVKYS